jgi:hypothetical protein
MQPVVLSPFQPYIAARWLLALGSAIQSRCWLHSLLLWLRWLLWLMQ